MLYNYFPYQSEASVSKENVAFHLFGARFFTDQGVSELLTEFLLVIFSQKRFGSDESELILEALPTLPQMQSKEPLVYAPKIRLNLKLFSFLGASRLDTRHRTHRKHYEELIFQLLKKIDTTNNETKNAIIKSIENLFLGFQGAGSGRTWCAQSFIPISPAFLAGESLWKETAASKDTSQDWQEVLGKGKQLFSMNQHIFLARGGELLYVQLCNALLQPHDTIKKWCLQNNFGLSREEQDPQQLRDALNTALSGLMDSCPSTLTKLAELIDEGLDPETAKITDQKNGKTHFVTAGWCNTESWQEGYLFAVELLRLLQSNLDMVDRIYLMETACAMHVLRSLSMQSIRTLKRSERKDSIRDVDGVGYRFVVSALEEKDLTVRRLSQGSLNTMEKYIFQVVRSNQVVLPDDEKKRTSQLKQADTAYGTKYFRKMGKAVGLVVPKTGRGARFVLTEQILRMLVITSVPHGKRLTYETFKQIVEQRHGLVFDAGGLFRAKEWLSGQGSYLPTNTDAWLQNMLEAAGFLIHLSDSCALVHNPTDAKR